MRAFICILCIFAIISSTISPACASITGKYGDWIEICDGLGIKKIQDRSQSDLPDVTQNDCDFCFQHNHLNILMPDDIVSILPEKQIFGLDLISKTIRPHSLHPYQSRAPPIFS